MHSPAGASLLAMVVNDKAENLTPRGAFDFFASRLAPTGDTAQRPSANSRNTFPSIRYRTHSSCGCAPRDL
ncbi:hypothetical protein CD175_11175 [Pseudomonas laurylsulfatiphila]|uniref:Uncharacterized protein n=1 Tax=Pseudomonas laurylsulfatiphila TaxID=2011015 RepID=A0A2S6FLR5_9PSED|nr:hypothetical protein CD175_11175 [Pseudomonas laurylsulfatiphila]